MRIRKCLFFICGVNCRFDSSICLKQLFTIFLLCNMLFLQYSRQAAYIQCKLINAIESKHCDCEKIMADKDHSLKEHNSLPSSTIKMNMPDETFLFVAVFSAPFNFSQAKHKPTAFIKNFHPQNFAKELIRPPKV